MERNHAIDEEAPRHWCCAILVIASSEIQRRAPTIRRQ
jgi:hypothetical protein